MNEHLSEFAEMLFHLFSDLSTVGYRFTQELYEYNVTPRTHDGWMFSEHFQFWRL